MANAGWTNHGCGSTPECVSVDAKDSKGPALHRAQGFLMGVTKRTPSSLIAPLRPRHWRVSSEEMLRAAKSYGAKVTWIVSDSWQTAAGGRRPWNNWSRYEQFVRTLVRKSIAEQRHVDYWDIINEPGSHSTKGGRVWQFLETYRRAHDAIRSVAPSAKIVGPSIGTFADKPYGGTPASSMTSPYLDLQTFLDYVARFKLQFDALSWHEIWKHSKGPSPITSPTTVVDHVARARDLLARYPSLGRPEIHVNEYVFPESWLIPGWEVAWLASLEQANVDAAMRACFFEMSSRGSEYSACYHGVLDGLFEEDELTPRPVYWVHRAYADMTGTRIAAKAEPGLAVHASITDRKVVHVLLGRFLLCTRRSNPGCTESRESPPADVQLRVRHPFGSGEVRIVLRRIPNLRGGLTEPWPLIDDASRVDGDYLRIRIDRVPDGDAFALAIYPT